jgi:hypothetical protein
MIYFYNRRLLLCLLLSLLTACKEDNFPGTHFDWGPCKLTSMLRGPRGGEEYEYTSNSYLKTIRYTSNGARTNLTYGTNGQLSQSASSGSYTNVVDYEYDGQNRWTKAVEKSPNSRERVYKATYDADGNRSKVELEEGGKVVSTHTFVYAGGNLVEAISSRTTGGAPSVSRYEYYPDLENKLKLWEDRMAPLKLVVGTASKNLLKRAIHPDGTIVDYTYELNEKGYPVAGNTSSSNTLNLLHFSTSTFTYECR